MQLTTLFNSESDGLANWQLSTDQVMGGVSQGKIQVVDGVVHFSANVSYQNNGGFAKLRWALAKNLPMDNFSGVWFEVKADSSLELVALLKSSQLWMPWQSFRKVVKVTQDWQKVFIPFGDFSPYRTHTRLNPRSITQFSMLIGHEGTHSIQVRGFGLFV